MTAKGSRVSFWGNENFPKLFVAMATKPHGYTSHGMAHFKWMRCMVFELFLNKVVGKYNALFVSHCRQDKRSSTSALLPGSSRTSRPGECLYSPGTSCGFRPLGHGAWWNPCPGPAERSSPNISLGEPSCTLIAPTLFIRLAVVSPARLQQLEGRDHAVVDVVSLAGGILGAVGSVWGLAGKEERSPWLCLGLPSHGADRKQTDSFITIFCFLYTMCLLVALPRAPTSPSLHLGKSYVQCLAPSG